MAYVYADNVDTNFVTLHGYFDVNGRLPLGGNRTPEYYFPRYFSVPADQTLIFGRVGSSIAPVDLGWLAHQVRPIRGGAEMRSRFFLNIRGLHVPDLPQAACAIARGASVDPTDLFLGIDLARDLLMHCGQEMNHLAGFLPELYEEFHR